MKNRVVRAAIVIVTLVATVAAIVAVVAGGYHSRQVRLRAVREELKPIKQEMIDLKTRVNALENKQQ